NETLKEWLPGEQDIHNLLNLSDKYRTAYQGEGEGLSRVRVAYPVRERSVWNGGAHMIAGRIEPELDGSGDVAGVRGLEIAPDMPREPLNATKERANLGPHTLTVGDDLIGQVPL